MSVLFFALLIGGAPGMAVAEPPTSTTANHTSPSNCSSNGGVWVSGDGAGVNPNGYCDFSNSEFTWEQMVGTEPWCSLMRAGQVAGSIDAAVMGFVLGGPVGGVGAALFVGAMVEIYITYHCG